MEIWDLYDRNGEPLGRTVERGKRLRAGEHHLVVHVWIVNSVGRLLIQRRSPALRLMPNVWAVTGGSAVAGEDSLTAVRRELREELGLALHPEDLELLGRLNRRNSLCDVWFAKKDAAVPDLRFQREEVADARWVTLEQLREMIGDGRFHNYGEPYFRFVFSEIEKRMDT
jgi:isopentenyldiphosphate isomerase